MKSTIAVEFSVKAGEVEFKEENVSFSDPEQFLSFISTGGGCDTIPDEVDEIQLVFLQPPDKDDQNPVAGKRVTLELGMVFITGPLAEIMEVVGQIIEKAGRGELSASFIRVINVGR